MRNDKITAKFACTFVFISGDWMQDSVNLNDDVITDSNVRGVTAPLDMDPEIVDLNSVEYLTELTNAMEMDASILAEKYLELTNFLHSDNKKSAQIVLEHDKVFESAVANMAVHSKFVLDASNQLVNNFAEIRNHMEQSAILSGQMYVFAHACCQFQM